MEEIAASGAGMNGCSDDAPDHLRSQHHRQARQRRAAREILPEVRRRQPARRASASPSPTPARTPPASPPRPPRRRRLRHQRPQGVDHQGRRVARRWCSSPARHARGACAGRTDGHDVVPRSTSTPSTSSSGRSRRWAATRSRPTRWSSTTSSSPATAAIGEEGRASGTFSTVSTPSGSCSPTRRWGWAGRRCERPAAMPRSGWCSAARSGKNQGIAFPLAEAPCGWMRPS